MPYFLFSQSTRSKVKFPENHVSQNISASLFLDSLLQRDLKKHTTILNNRKKYKLQVIYTKIDRDKNNRPSFKDFQFHLSKAYVYPASTVKLPIALLTLVKLSEINRPGLNPSSTMITDSAFFCQKKIMRDSTSSTGYPSIENYIKKMFLVSDNQAFARTYEFVGYDYAHEKLKELGFKNIRLFNRLEGQCTADTARTMPPIYFLNEANDTIYKQPISTSLKKLVHPIKSSKAGRFHQNAKGKWITGAKDFSDHNYLEMTDLHHLMKGLVFNNFADVKNKLPISDTSRLFMLKQLGLYPRESDYPKYDKKFYYDSFKKFFIYGSAATVIDQDSLRIINIVGRAYGFLIDCAYIIDLKNNLEFLLTASVYVNKNGNIGSGRYEYDQLGYPFLKDLSLCLYRYERKRKRQFTPDLSEFRNLFKKD
jgi:hypothetical protein